MIEIIANIGSAHYGSLWRAKALVKAAAKAGANSIAIDAYYKTVWKSISLPPSLVPNWLDSLIAICAESKLGLIFTPRTVQAVKALAKYGAGRYNVFSTDVDYAALLWAIAETGKPVSLDVSLSTNAEIETALGILKTNESTLLHFMGKSSLWTKTANATRILDLIENWQLKRKEWYVPVGLSSNLKEWWVDAACAVYKPVCIEKPLTLGWPLSGKAGEHSLTPREFAQFVMAVRDIELATNESEHGVEYKSEK